MSDTGPALRPILVIEDEDDAREALLLALELAGYPAVGVPTASAALAMLRQKQVCPSLILLDLFLPGATGWQFREEQSRHADLASIPVIVVSGYPHTLETFQQGGLRAAAAFRKPVELNALLAVISEHVERRPSAG